MSIRVFHIISHFDIGGAERVAVSIAMSNNENVEYHIIELLRGKSAFTHQFIRELEDAGVKCHRSWIPDIHFHFLLERIAALLFPLRFMWIWYRWHPTVIHTHTEGPDLATLAVFKALPYVRRKCRIVRTIHNTRLWTGQEIMGGRAERFFMHNSVNIAISQAVANAYRRVYGEPTGMIYNGMAQVTQETFPYLRRGKVNILFAARLESQKGIRTLIEIVKRMAMNDRYFFHIYGSGSMNEYVKTIQEQNNVEIGKPIFGISKFMASFDYLLMPSEYEGLALTSIEASLAGLPTIINHAEGLYETLPDDWPLTVYANDVDEYVNLLENVLPKLSREELSSKARHFAMSHFSIEKMREEYEKAYANSIS